MRKQHKIDLFGKLLPELDKRNLNVYNEFTDEEKKTISPIVLMKWMSSTTSYSEYSILAINEIVNKKFWNLYEHPDLQLKLMSLCGIGKKLRHEWIPFSKKENQKKIVRFLKEQYPLLNFMEIDLLLKDMDKNDIKSLCIDFGLQDDEIKEMLKDYDK